MAFMIPRYALRCAVFELLKDRGPMGAGQIAQHLSLSRKYVHKGIPYWLKMEFVTVDKSIPRGHIFAVTTKGLASIVSKEDDEPLPVQIHRPFQLPDNLRGPVRSPMAWSMVHLLGVV